MVFSITLSCPGGGWHRSPPTPSCCGSLLVPYLTPQLSLINYYCPSDPHVTRAYLILEEHFCFASADVLIVPSENIKGLRVSTSRLLKFLPKSLCASPNTSTDCGVGTCGVCSFYNKSRVLGGTRQT